MLKGNHGGHSRSMFHRDPLAPRAICPDGLAPLVGINKRRLTVRQFHSDKKIRMSVASEECPERRLGIVNCFLLCQAIRLRMSNQESGGSMQTIQHLP